jgi:hypothetical protein
MESTSHIETAILENSPKYRLTSKRLTTGPFNGLWESCFLKDVVLVRLSSRSAPGYWVVGVFLVMVGLSILTKDKTGMKDPAYTLSMASQWATLLVGAVLLLIALFKTRDVVTFGTAAGRIEVQFGLFGKKAEAWRLIEAYHEARSKLES